MLKSITQVNQNDKQISTGDCEKKSVNLINC